MFTFSASGAELNAAIRAGAPFPTSQAAMHIGTNGTAPHRAACQWASPDLLDMTGHCPPCTQLTHCASCPSGAGDAYGLADTLTAVKELAIDWELLRADLAKVSLTRFGSRRSRRQALQALVTATVTVTRPHRRLQYVGTLQGSADLTQWLTARASTCQQELDTWRAQAAAHLPAPPSEPERLVAIDPCHPRLSPNKRDPAELNAWFLAADPLLWRADNRCVAVIAVPQSAVRPAWFTQSAASRGLRARPHTELPPQDLGPRHPWHTRDFFAAAAALPPTMPLDTVLTTARGIAA